MLISELIEHLQQIKQDNGDLECCIFNFESLVEGELNLEPVFCILESDEDDKPSAVTFVDFETFAAFNDTDATIN